MTSTLMIWLGVAVAAIVIALMLWRQRRRLSANTEAELATARNASFAGGLISFAAAIGIGRAQADAVRDGNVDGCHSWSGSHLSHHHHGGYDGGGYSGGDAGGGGGGI